MNFESKISGYYKIEAVNKDGQKRVVCDWFPNLITDYGLDRMAVATDYLTYCQVGSGSSAPSFSDVALVNKIAATSTIQSTTTSCSTSSPYYFSIKKVFRFGAGVATGNLTEIGVGWASSGSLFSRSLIKDIGGNPVSITVLPDEFLDVTYEFRYYADETDKTGSVLINGTTHNWTVRHAAVTNVDSYDGWSLRNETTMVSAGIYPYWSVRLCSGVLAAITSAPTGELSGYSAGDTSGSGSTYINGTRTSTYAITWGLTTGNGTINSIKFIYGIGAYQIGFDTPIIKTSSDVLTMTFTHSWGRY